MGRKNTNRHAGDAAVRQKHSRNDAPVNTGTANNPQAPACQIDDAILVEHADAIRNLGKQTIDSIIEIGRHLTEAKAILGHGNWLPWLDREFGWSDRTALNFMRVHALALKSETVSDLDLPVRALYLLAAP